MYKDGGLESWRDSRVYKQCSISGIANVHFGMVVSGYVEEDNEMDREKFS